MKQVRSCRITYAAPLYRSRKAIIVGDAEQLEPIRLLKTNLIETARIPVVLQDQLCVQRNSVQDYADRNSDVTEMTPDRKKKGMLLTEHRRCENSIMQFSNRFVYKNLTIVKEDNHDKLFGRNLVAFDVRGLKERHEHRNQSEVEFCRKLVQEYVEAYGEDIKRDIAIITPFASQRAALKQAVPDVDVGIVHTFQGQERRSVLFSTVVDDLSEKSAGLMHFIGGKSNMLNVAMSRAKEQFIMLGNLRAITASGNSLADAFSVIRELGYVYSPYDEADVQHSDEQTDAYRLYVDPELLSQQPNIDFNRFLENHCKNSLLIGPEKHYQLLLESIRLAKRSVVIFSPWIQDYVVNAEFLDLVQDAMIRSVEIKVCFGYRGGKDVSLLDLDTLVSKDYSMGKHERIVAAIQGLKDLIGTNLKYVPPMHTQILLVDEGYLFLGSHNWLSKKGTVSKRDEIGCLITSQQSIQYLLSSYIEERLS